MVLSTQSNTSFRDLIEAFFRRKKVVLVTLSATLVAVLLWCIVAGRLYQSEMKFLVQNARGNVVLSPERGASSVAGDVTEAQINSTLELLHSRDVLDDVVEPGWSSKPVSGRSSEELTQHDKLLKELENRLVVDAGRKSNVITVTNSGSTPEEARETLNRLSIAFLNKQRNLERPAGATDFFVQQAEFYRKAWNQASQRLVDFQREHQFVSLPDDEASVEKDILTLQAQLREVETSLRASSGKLAGSQRRLASTTAREMTEQRMLPNQQLVQELTTQIVQLENKRTSLLTQFKPDDRLVQEVDQQLRQTRAALAQSSGTTSVEASTNVNPVWEQLRVQQAQDYVTNQSLQEQRASIAQHIKGLQDQLGEDQGLTTQFDQLKSNADQLKENYQLYSQKKDQAQIEDAMDAHQLLNVSIAESPTLSNTPVRPRPFRDLALALLTGCFLSLGLIYLMELGRTTIVNPRELEAVSTYPVLATVPVVSAEIVKASTTGYHDSLHSSTALLEWLVRDSRRGRLL